LPAAKTCPRYPHYPQADSCWCDSDSVTVSSRGREEADPETDRDFPSDRSVRKRRRDRKGTAPGKYRQGGERSHATISASGCGAGFRKPPDRARAPRGQPYGARELRSRGDSEACFDGEPVGKRPRLRPCRNPRPGTERLATRRRHADLAQWGLVATPAPISFWPRFLCLPPSPGLCVPRPDSGRLILHAYVR
jgi:hypothetical protein